MEKDCFHLNKINKDLIECFSVLTTITPLCENYLLTPNSENGEKLVNIFQEIEKKMMKVKQNIAKMVDELERNDIPEAVIEVQESDKGYKLS